VGELVNTGQARVKVLRSPDSWFGVTYREDRPIVVESIRKLIAKGATSRVKDKRQQLPLHRAAAVGSIPMMKLLLENKSPINATDIDSMTALHHAISEGHGDGAVFLLKEGAQSDKRDSEGNLAIQLAPDVKIKTFILQSAEREGIDLTTA